MKQISQYILYIISFAFSININDGQIYDKSWALVVGINDYDAVSDLNYAVEDALAIKNMLINEFGFDRNNVRYLIDKEANQSNINKEFSNLLKSAGKNDRVVFYFAGHGETEEMGIEEGDVGFLMPVDADVENLYFTAIDMVQLKRIAKLSKAKHMLFLVDACYGGLAAVNTRSLNLNTPNYLDKITQENSRQIITAGGKDEKVIEKDDWEHSAFTKNILSGLKDKKADQNDDGYITGSEIGLYLQENVSIDTENFQTPQVRRLTTHEGEILFVAKNFDEPEKNKDELDYQQILQEMILQMSQQNQKTQISINENQRVIKPGSIGLFVKNPSQEVMIESIFLRPTGLAYKGKLKLSIDASDEINWSRTIIIELDDVLEISGETETGIYNYNTGNVD